jgi:hypothetical protein
MTSSTPQNRSGAQPWLGLRIFLIGSVLLIATKVDDESHTLARELIVLLWVMVAFAAMLKEGLTYGLGDRVTLFGMVLILAVSVTATLIDNHPYSFVSLGSIIFALIMLRQVILNVLERQKAVEPWDGPGS